ncbi:MAG: winged helix-turn-helix domain-containing protein [Paenibacillus macerans]|uniref:Metalloregulator ArsR/SmtB family transcription factor n=1 Tax=Paenibacillus macerans TaxID=44252 RepID=A0A6N8ERU4_PAEMA|nr:winged helix-turn-helix domain-containing protein [Paenibacillus macerans]MBS5912920.1 winged helix-turn-helix transcriptional regulator [Paenibacillus macerans]MDU7471730.1 winged helix-turn-helix domain-containing protein [Paenibacillus macerans]MUG21181.1 metalloregulator ArsR/SmtB family transcription factor [Paenibacillus macerans]GBK62386.1 ArsR family transcriptional regulator [Paenibacillus macerans]GBK68698.1 ArsR family transcriptional regulator [Paenibacillus macerans]
MAIVNTNVALIASMVSDASRSAILNALMDGRFHAAGELARMAGIQPQTASFHLAKMVDAGLIAVEKQGRHRYYGIRNPEVAQVMESLLSIAPPVKIKSLRQSAEEQTLRKARTCYDHLAGNLGVSLTQSLVREGILLEGENGFEVTKNGEAFFENFQIDLNRVKRKRRSFSHKCLDWSERRHHLAGALGHALLDRLLELNWVQRLPNTRAVKITPQGKAGLKETFALEVED